LACPDLHGARISSFPPIIDGRFTLGREPGQFGLFPAAAALGADLFEEFVSRLNVGVAGAPVCGQVPAKGRGEDRLA